VKFSANLSMLFAERPFVERFERAARAGFSAVEFWWPDGEDLAAVESAAADAGVQVVMMNFYAGDMAAGDRGLMSDPARHGGFRENVPVALDLAQRLGCRQLNALVGGALDHIAREDQLELARENLAWAAQQAAPLGMRVLVEAVNTVDNDSRYLVASTADAIALIDRADTDGLGLLYDAYHMQRMEGNLTATLRRHADRIHHIHVADAPERHEPGTGEINFPYVLGTLAEIGYDGYVGLEYRPSTEATEDSLGWLRDFRCAAASGRRP
jgi:hydroxypyruvate isomerase